MSWANEGISLLAKKNVEETLNEMLDQTTGVIVLILTHW